MSKKWTQSVSIPYDFYGGAIVVYNNKIHILGGSSRKSNHYSFDGVSWVSEGSLPYDFYYGNAVVYDNKIHLLGSGNNSPNTKRYHYSWDGTSWSAETSIPFEFHSGNAVVYNNKIHVMGGTKNKTAHYSWNGTSWSAETSLPFDFAGGTQNVVVYDNKIHILGGSQTSTAHYSLNGNSWTQESTLPYQFYYGSAIIFNNKIHIFGGYQNVNNHYSWDGNSWIEEPSCTFEYYGALSAQYGDDIHTLGGYNSGYTTQHFYYSDSKDYNKVIYGNKTLIDLTSDTVAPEYLLQGYTAHSKTGEIIEGSYVSSGKKVIVGTETGSSAKKIEIVCDFTPGIMAIWNETKKTDSNYSNTAVKIPGMGSNGYFVSSQKTTFSGQILYESVEPANSNSPKIGYVSSTNTVIFMLPKNSPWYVGTYKYMIIEE